MTRRDASRALQALLTLWRARPSPQLADRLDVISAWYAPTLPPLTPEDWMQIASAGHVVDVPRLAHALADAPEAEIIDRLRWLDGQPRDPRWTAAVVALAVRGFNARNRLEGRIARVSMRALHQLRDDRAVDLLTAADLRARGYWGERVEASLESLQKAVAPRAERLFSDRDLATVDAAIATLCATAPPDLAQLRPPPARTHAELLAMIHDAPDDADARLIFADWSEQAGDPRAEFLRLQFRAHAGPLTRDEARRQAHLLGMYAARWLGPLAPHVEDVEWSLGFARAANVRIADRRRREDVLSLPGWRTLVAVHAVDPRILRHPNLANVRQLGRAGDFMSPTARPTPIPRAVLLATRPQPLEAVIVEAADLPEMAPEDFETVRDLTVVHPLRAGSNPQRFLARFAARQVTLWNADLGWSRAFDRVAHLDVLRLVPPAGTLRLALVRRPTGVHLDVVWLGKLRCRSLAPALDVAARHQPATVQIHTPLYAHRAETLAGWAGDFGDARVTLPRARAPLG